MHLVTEPPAADPRTRRLLVGFAIASLGTGLTVPFLFVHLARVRDLGAGTAGLLYAWMGLVGILAALAAGPLLDRRGSRPVLLGALGVGASALTCLALLPLDAGVGVMLPVLAGVVLGAAPLWPATTALLARWAGPHAAVRDRLLAQAFLALNAGIGVGSVLGALVVDVDRAGTFRLLFLGQAATCLVFALIVIGGGAGGGDAGPDPDPSRRPGTAAASAPEAEAGWSVVLADRRMLLLCGCGVLAVTFGYGQIEAGATAYAVEVAGVPAAALGWAFAANTLVVLLAQLPVLRWVGAWRRTSALGLAVALWSVAWVVVAAADPLGGLGAAPAIAALVVGLAVFGLGETLWAPVAAALADDLATDATRGRHHAALGLVWTLGQMLGPAIAGLLIGSGHGHLWALLVVAATAVTAVLLRRFRRLLRPEEDGVPSAAASASSADPVVTVAR
ncbi:MFS transporter [Nocardioides fonticola]|uniref:MFS transporter n=1 Tax=Nocardioides fonticola TaxID=450363 RepID=A0ABP7XAX3_9ACTN